MQLLNEDAKKVCQRTEDNKSNAHVTSETVTQLAKLHHGLVETSQSVRSLPFYQSSMREGVLVGAPESV